jgi:hypothetical protein
MRSIRNPQSVVARTMALGDNVQDPSSGGGRGTGEDDKNVDPQATFD